MFDFCEKFAKIRSNCILNIKNLMENIDEEPRMEESPEEISLEEGEQGEYFSKIGDMVVRPATKEEEDRVGFLGRRRGPHPRRQNPPLVDAGLHVLKILNAGKKVAVIELPPGDPWSRGNYAGLVIRRVGTEQQDMALETRVGGNPKEGLKVYIRKLVEEA